VAERDFTNDWDDPNNPYGQNRRPDVYGTDGGTGAGNGSGGGLPGWDPRSWDDGYGDPNDGIGSPESGYGVGGVNNPAYGNNGDPSPQSGNGQVVAPLPLVSPNTNTDTRPSGGGGGGQPAFQPAAPVQMAPAQQASAPSTQQPKITDEVTKILMARLNELKTPGDLNNDPVYQQALRANQIGLMRGADKQRKALAERSAASGTRATGGFNVGVRGIQERTGEQGAQYAAGLGLDRLQARENQLLEAIRLARAVGQDDLANQLEVQRLQLQQELGRGDLALRAELGRGQLGLGYDNLGFNYADMIQRANSQAAIAGLRG
jgi:hypothetical protein